MSTQQRKLNDAYCSDCFEKTKQRYSLVATLFTAEGGTYIAQGNIKCTNCYAESPISSETIMFYEGSIKLQKAQNGWGAAIYNALFS